MKSLLRLFLRLIACGVLLCSVVAQATTITYQLSLATGWNLVGNSLSTPINAKTIFGGQAGIVTVWKWNASNRTWAFYAPSLDTNDTLATYASGKGYSVLDSIYPGEGYWVNASTPLLLGSQSGTGESLTADRLTTGWNLSATGDAVTPAVFSTRVGNVTTLWAWDNPQSKWYFYAPSLAANNSLASYIAGKGYLDFGSGMLDNGSGFWVNYAGGGAGNVAATGAQLAAGEFFSVMMNSDGTVSAWGENTYGQLGDGTSATSVFTQVSGLTSVVAISAGYSHSAVLRADGTVWTWGRNDLYELGDGTATARSTPVQVSITGVKAIAAGAEHTLALKIDGTVWAWGLNGKGQLGDGTTTNRPTPVQISGLANVIAIAGGLHHSLAVKSDGTVWAWGDGPWGELGTGAFSVGSLTPVQVSGLTGITAVAAGMDHSVALKNDGTVWAWGRNLDGQLGDGTYQLLNGTTNNQNVPVQVSGLSNVTAIAARENGALAIKADGTLWSWGYNYFGELGDGSNIDRHIAIQVAGLTGVTSISTGTRHGLARTTDGRTWAWGTDVHYQLGAGEYFFGVSMPNPVQVGYAFDKNLGKITSTQVSTGDGQVTLSFLSSATTTHNIYYGTSSGITKTTATKIANAAFDAINSRSTVTGLVNGTRYYFFITGEMGGVETEISNVISAIPEAPIPGKPAGVTATAGNGQITVNWPAVTGASSYNLYYLNNTRISTTNSTAVINVTSPYTITGLSNFTAYSIIVTAVSDGGESAASNAVTATPALPPSAPTGAAALAGDGEATVSWNAVSGATGYNLYYGSSSGVTIATGTKVTGAVSGSAVTGLGNGTTYYFIVTALNAIGESIASTAATVTPVAPSTGPKLFVYTANSNNVSVFSVNTDTGALTAGTAVTAGSTPVSVAVHPNGKTLYVANSGSNNVSVFSIDQATGALTAGTPVAAGAAPSYIRVSADGKFVYVTNKTANTVSIYSVDAVTGALTDTGLLGYTGPTPSSIALDPTGKFAYVTNQAGTTGGNSVRTYTVDAASGALTTVAQPVVRNAPRASAVDPAGKYLYVLASGYASLTPYAIDQTNGTLTAGNDVFTGSQPYSMALSPNGNFAYVPSYASGNVSVYSVDMTTGALTSGTSATAGTNPSSVVVSPDNKFAYVTNFGSNNVSVYSIDQTSGVLTAGTTASSGGNPKAIAITPFIP
ncbi:MAG: hypothetical protein AUJ20_01115 [Comamonadaceae bacterium CG1_02_60_18]|nr:MAG: hypothetical protein AUJ20_01115 [Comamonadaceae bacterium CG1_02_60_18]PIQ51016.1 MAG: hypothetical protein COW02_16935 [Comamonadaceae bacterium CG12_big_fil_rev_8_21_14_0_65_59_15]